jgi:hypothetical protein
VDYLPYRGRITIADRQRATFRSILPADIGSTTRLVSAAKGGRFELAGLGTVRVAPGALRRDCSLRLIPIPAVSRSDVLTGAGKLRHQVWLTAHDERGQPAHDALPTAPGAITLEIAVPEGYVTPDNAMLETWTTHCLGRFDQAATSVGQCSGKTVIMPLGAGHNLLLHDYRTPTADPNCQLSPWELRVVLIGQRVIADGPSVPVICGVITQACSYRIRESMVFTTKCEFEADDLATYGVSSTAPLVDLVSMEVGFSSKYDPTTNTIETLGKQQYLGTVAGTTLSRHRWASSHPATTASRQPCGTATCSGSTASKRSGRSLAAVHRRRIRSRSSRSSAAARSGSKASTASRCRSGTRTAAPAATPPARSRPTSR